MPRPFHLGEQSQVQPPARSMPRLPCSLGYNKQVRSPVVDDLSTCLYIFEKKSTTSSRLSEGSRVCFKETVEPRLPF